MTKPMERPEPTTIETPLELEKLFFSRTDERGVILSGNEVFQQISGYSWERLIGAPHKLVRHPDMPKGVFHLMWERIEQGKPTAAYVKNMTEDGHYYWVLALVSRVKDGYLSVRLKPTSDFFAKIPDEYATLEDLERGTPLTPEGSAEVLQTRLADMGFDSYDSFMSQAVAKEVGSRNLGLHGTTHPKVERFDHMLTSIHSVIATGQEILRAFRKIRTTPLNMGVQATKLGNGAGPISVIANNYGELAMMIQSSIEGLLGAANELLEIVEQSLSWTCFAIVQWDVIAQFVSEDDLPEAIDKERETRLLEQQAELFEAEALSTITRQVDSFWMATKTLKRTLSALDLTRIFCKIETARLGEPSGTMAGIVDQLQAFQTKTQQALQAIEADSERLQNGLSRQVA